MVPKTTSSKMQCHKQKLAKTARGQAGTIHLWMLLLQCWHKVLVAACTKETQRKKFFSRGNKYFVPCCPGWSQHYFLFLFKNIFENKMITGLIWFLPLSMLHDSLKNWSLWVDLLEIFHFWPKQISYDKSQVTAESR